MTGKGAIKKLVKKQQLKLKGKTKKRRLKVPRGLGATGGLHSLKHTGKFCAQ